MELLVAVTLFTVSLTMLTDIFLLATRAQRKAFSGSKVISDSRLILGTVSDTMRSAGIDYTYPGYAAGVPVPTEELVLRDNFGKQITFRKSSDVFVCPSPESVPCVEMVVDDGETVASASISSKDVKVIGLDFYVSPTKNPFQLLGESYEANQQPLVTVNLALQSTSLNAIEASPLYAQTSISSRNYER